YPSPAPLYTLSLHDALPISNPGSAPDYAPAVWRASPNVDQRPADQTGTLHMVIIHTCESDYASCWSWLVNPASQASAHYVVDERSEEHTSELQSRENLVCRL